ncbi:metallophosphoesterase [Aquisalimonas sp.]|uniref:metallophosphoesterase n=1 Tax=unclassified Aquisalimonas TaxID=2644645 RepID=UPI0025C24EDF|nr:metallophosphoesterase [Aquisalimonas sp.]
MLLKALGWPRRRTSDARVHRLPANEHGRDLVIGDLHGHRATLEAALEALRFDPSRDRVISVGDLVDRGPDSRGCLRLLETPWFHAVMGNHEDLLIGAVRQLSTEGGTDARFAVHQNNGGEWLLANWPADASLTALIERVRQLPHVLVVGNQEYRYHVVHAGFSKDVTDADIDVGAPGCSRTLIWQRDLGLALQRLQAEWGGQTAPTGLSTTYCGHMPAADCHGLPLRGFGHVNLDTGVSRGQPLTIAVRSADGGETIHQQPLRT